jgi:hypothetical protein
MLYSTVRKVVDFLAAKFDNFSSYFYYTFKCILGDGNTVHCEGAHPGKNGGIQALACVAPFSQTVGSLLRTHWPAKPYVKIDKLYMNNIRCGTCFFTTKMMFANFTIFQLLPNSFLRDGGCVNL